MKTLLAFIVMIYFGIITLTIFISYGIIFLGIAISAVSIVMVEKVILKIKNIFRRQR